MITYEEALRKAKNRNEDYDYVKEYQKLYLFSVQDVVPSFGGYGGPVAVLKENGQMLGITALVEGGMGDWMNEDQFVRQWMIEN